MSKTMKRLGALAVALAMSVAMAGTAWAATTTNGVATSEATSIDIEKSILVFNANGSTVYKPGITYNYSVAPATVSNITVTDVEGNSAVVQAGVAGGVTLSDSQAVFAATETTSAANNGTAITDTITASVDLDKFTKAGVYRYVITETQPANLTAVGITRPSAYDSTRYLDVYIKNGANGLEVYGYVCFIGNDTIDAKTTANNKITGKTTGFVEQYDTDVTTGETMTGNVADRYYTYDFTITKAITGDLADMTHAFPFVLATSNAVTGQQFMVAKAGSGSGSISAGVNNGVAAIGTDVAATLGNGDTITVTGLPANAKFNVTETNDADDAYKVSISGVKDTDNAAETEVAKNGTKAVNAAAVPISSYTAYNGSDPTTTGNYTAITFTNKLEAVSPTGVILRYGPFAFMIAAGIALLVVGRRRRQED